MVADIPDLRQRVIAQRKASGADRYDEMWEGYMMTPMADNEHRHLVNQLATVLTVVVDWPGLGQVFPGVNVCDRRDDWARNFRCPDVAVFRKGTRAENRGTHWYGGPDLAIEIISPGDQAMKKLPFYAAVGTAELLVIGRQPWSMRLHASKVIHWCTWASVA